MADLKISELSALAGANLVAADELAIVDDSASETKKITVSDLIANGVTVISDDTIPGAKILFAAGDIATAALADSAVTTAKVADDAVTAAKLANESTVDLVTTLPASGAFTGQLALDTDDNSLYAWDGSAWQSLKAPGSINTVSGSTTGEVNIVATTSGSTVTVSATLDDTTAAAQFLAGPTGAAGTVGYRAISGTDLPTATTTAKGGVIVNGNGLTMDSDTIEIDNTVTASSTHHVVTYNAQGLITGGRAITSADLPIATSSAVGGVIAGSGLAVDVSGNLSIDNTVTSGTYTKVTVSAQGVVTAGDTLVADDIPNHSAAKLTSGTIGTSLIANDAITAAKLADQSTVLFGGALGSDNVTIFPAGDYKGQMFWDETSEDLYIYTGSAFIPITVLSGNLVNAGSYNANTNLMSSVTTAGSSAGFSAGSALPAPAATNLNHYVVVDTSGTGSGAAPAVALAPPDMLLSQGVGTEYALIDVSNAIAGQTASNISVIASGNIAATDVQAALQELDTEKLQKAGDTMTGALGIGTASSIVFEGSSADDYETTLTVTDPTADRTITLPNITGTVVTTGDTGSVTSTMITDGTIVNADINASAEIAVSKLANGTARQLLQTDSAGTGVEFTSNVDVPGTLDVTGAATLDSTLTVTGLISADGKVSFPAGTAAAPSLYSGSDTDTGIYSPGSDQLAISTGGTGRLFIDSSGRLLVGQSSSPSIGSGQYAKIFVAGYAGGSPGGAIISIARDEAASAMSSGDTVGELIFSDNTGGTFAAVKGSADAAPGTNDFPGRLAFLTTADGASSPTERMRIDSSGNVGIGTTSPDHGKLTLFDSASAAFNALVIQQGNTGSTASDGLHIGIDSAVDAYITHKENRAIAFGTANTERMRIDSAGKVGIGGSPTYMLDVQGTDAALRLKGTSNTGFIADQASSGLVSLINYDSGADIRFGTGSTERMRIDSSGRVGIGTTTTQHSTLAVADTTNGPTIEMRPDNSGVTDIHATHRAVGGNSPLNLRGSDIRFGSVGLATTEAMRIDSSGRLLAGTSSARGDFFNSLWVPQVQLEGTNDMTSSMSLTCNKADAQRPVFIFAKTRGTTVGSDGLVASDDNLGMIAFMGNDGSENVASAYIQAHVDGTPGANDMPGRLTFWTAADGASSPVERMRISNNGTVSIGTNNTPTGPGLNVYGISTSNNDGAAAFGNGNTAADACVAAFYTATNSTATSNVLIKFGINNYASGSGRINANGAGQAAFGSFSDRRLKENVIDLSSQWENIKNLRPVEFDFIESQGGGHQIGFIAQEVETVYPDAVTSSPMFNGRDQTPGEDRLTLTGWSKTEARLVKALQEAIAKIETLEQRLSDAGIA
jgi:hypothetical protein